MDPALIPPPVNNFHDWPSWNYPTLYDQYCTNGTTIPGEKNVLAGILYILEYLFFLCLYIPSLYVISQPKFFHHACYKLMFAIGIIENYVGFMHTFMAGILSIMGANYCDNTWLLIVVGHMVHVSWGLYSMSVVILAFNRCVEIHSDELADKLFAGRKAFLWMIPPWIYSIIFFSSTIDLPPIYNTVWSVYMFKIDFRDRAPPVTDWICFWNCAWVIVILVILYSLLLYRLKKTSQYQSDNKKAIKIQKHVMLQSFFICFFLFIVAFSYAIAGFIYIPNNMLKLATISVQICSGFTSIVYLIINKEIRKGVKKMFFGNSSVSSVCKTSMVITNNTNSMKQNNETKEDLII